MAQLPGARIVEICKAGVEQGTNVVDSCGGVEVRSVKSVQICNGMVVYAV